MRNEGLGSEGEDRQRQRQRGGRDKYRHCRGRQRGRYRGRNGLTNKTEKKGVDIECDEAMEMEIEAEREK